MRIMLAALEREIQSTLSNIENFLTSCCLSV